VSAVGLTVTLVPVTAPGLVPVLALITTDAAPLTVQVNVAVAPGAIDAGVAAKAPITGNGSGVVTVTVAERVTLPPAFVAVSTYVVVAAGVTTRLVPVTTPMPGAIVTRSAPVVAQFNVTGEPANTAAGVAAKDAIVGNGTVTFTVTVRVTLPVSLVAVRVYVVLALGVTAMLVPETAPIPGEIDTVVAPATDHDKVDAPPGNTESGAAENAPIVGNGGITVTAAVRVTLPPALVAFSV